MGIQFTEQQQEVIGLRDCNILVSAAAGSGKTAVLTERIAGMVCDEEHPVDVDRLLVVTFTNAAAAEMRERIGMKLSERLEQHPESEHLQRQLTLLHNAQITTIDSFCLFLLRNHFNEIGLDPSFRVMDEQEIKLLRQETLGELLEDWYTAGEQRFLDMVEVLCPRGKEKVLEDLILGMSRFAASFPWPEEWLLQRKQDYAAESVEDLKAMPFWDFLKHYVRGVLQGAQEKLQQAVELTQEPDGPYMYGDTLETERDQVLRLLERDEDDLEDLGTGVSGIVFGRLSSKADASVNAGKRNYVKKLREDVKKTLSELREQMFAWPMQVTLRRGKLCADTATVLVDLVLDFDRRVQAKKQEKKLIDFSDMEHLALDILLRREGDQILPSQVALQYREYFQEVLIDEYQDSNLVQEYLLKAVSGEEDGHFNRFMVGDVKQSIYRFRLARPELFLEKFGTYQRTGPLRRIDLSQNFRSRETVIQTVNQIFERMMSSEVGGIVYDDDAALHAGACYPEADGMESELIVVEKPEKGREIAPRQAEALAIADRIHELMQSGKVTDKKTGLLRRVQYRDIVILLRTLSKWGDVFQEALESRGIPVYVTSKSGYFSATEVQNLLSYLRVIDNPLQDVPLYGVLRSHFVGLTEEEIASLRGEEKKLPLYEQLQASPDPRVTGFLEKLSEYRRKMTYLPVRKLLEMIIWDYDYLNYVTALPGGEKRRANVEMLLVKASDFEKTSYYGLFHFVRYMEQLEKYEEDYGEADTLDENADVVRIMSIHKSKGLEFPVVFVSGMAKSFNLQDLKSAVAVDMDLGLGMDFIDGKKRLKSRTLRKNAIVKKLQEDILSEELRLFYVALTRAKEKLIMTAEQERLSFYEADDGMSGRADHLTYLDFMRADSCIEFLRPILRRITMQIRVVRLSDLSEQKKREQISFAMARQELVEGAGKVDHAAMELLAERFSFRYPHENLTGLFTKTTVSELKLAAMEEKDEGAYRLFEEPDTEEYLPGFRREQGEITGAVRGNAYHRVMELLDFQKLLGAQFSEVPADHETYAAALDTEKLERDLKAYLRGQVEDQRLSEEYLQAVRPEKICEFLRSSLGLSMWRACLSGKLHREQPFVLAIPATRLRADFPAEEKVLIQGIIDVYYEEDDGLVLLDYKTDSIRDLESLWKRYETQIDYYQEALERLTGKKVKERILYSFHLGRF